MASIGDLPDEILSDVFSLVIHNSRIFPNAFKTENTFRECVVLIDISRVCRRWRKVALTNPSLWSTLCVHLHDPSVKTLRQAAKFAEFCLARSQNHPLTCAITISHLKDLWLAHPLMQVVASHQSHWSRIAVDITPLPQPPEGASVDANAEEHSIVLKNVGARTLKEFRSNIGSWLEYSMSEPLPALQSLRIVGYPFTGCIYHLAKWLPLAPNLLELEVTFGDDRFSKHASEHKKRVEGATRREMGRNPHFLLPNLRSLNVWPLLLPYLTCPSLERYVMEYIPWNPKNSRNFVEFIERSAPSTLRTLEMKSSSSFLTIRPVLDYLLPTITHLLVTSPGEVFFNIFSGRSKDGLGFRLLPGLEHLEITNCADICLPFFLRLVTARWDIGVPHRTLKSVRLKKCFEDIAIPEILLSPPSGGIDLTQVEEKWRVMARIVNEGFLISVFLYISFQLQNTRINYANCNCTSENLKILVANGLANGEGDALAILILTRMT
ncbi:hypothetical protein SCHPADRAFT_896846 [Schizopora paradoxa]|uniref:F-box domain-containing protein n=1 Tax=Schizopora paradoxa TaxID=27342 RepID=A0A0H2R5C6_9AGAM|nr:hypothetical protein SCHPADRAFT_896846 [Schizopora paradoxa]